MKNTKAIVFDAYGTLFDVNSAAERCKDKIGEKWEGFANYWRTTQLEYTWLRNIMKRHKDFWKITEDSLDKSIKTFKVDPAMRNELLNLYKILSTYPEVCEVLKKLKDKNYKLAILSNGTPTLLKELVKINNLDNIFDDIFSIEDVGVFKPDSKVYDIPIIKYKIQKKEIAFLSANSKSDEVKMAETLAKFFLFCFEATSALFAAITIGLDTCWIVLAKIRASSISHFITGFDIADFRNESITASLLIFKPANLSDKKFSIFSPASTALALRDQFRIIIFAIQ